MSSLDSTRAALASGQHWFTTTHWRVVLAAGHDSSPQAAEALEQLCRTYWYPLYAYVRRRGDNPHDAQDLTQAFFERLLEKQYLGQVDPQKGKFRSFLIVALNHFLADERDRARCQKRGGGQAVILGMSESAIKSAVHRLRRRHRELLREEIARTVAQPEQIDEEIRYLLTVLGD